MEGIPYRELQSQDGQFKDSGDEQVSWIHQKAEFEDQGREGTATHISRERN